MKVIHLIGGGDIGGAKTHVLSLLSALHKTTGVKLVCFREGAFAEEARALGIDVAVLAHKNLFTACTSLRRMIRAGGFDLIHCHGARGNMMGAIMRMLTGVPALTTVHSDYRLDYMGRPGAHMTFGTINKLALRLLDFRIGVSDPVTDMLVSRGFVPDRLFTIYNGVDFAIEDRRIDRAAFLRSLGLSLRDGDVVAGIAARLTPVKDHATLIDALHKAVKDAPNLRLVLAGDGELADTLRRKAEELGLADRVCFAGWVEDMDAFYRAIDINVLTSVSETFSYAITEGARMSRPTISSRVGGLPKIILPEKTGLLFEAGDADTLAQHLVRLAGDALLRARLGGALRAHAEACFSIAAMVDTQRMIYKTALARAGRPRGRDGVVICGAYGKGNAGDEAILQAILGEMRDIDPDMPLTVMSRGPRTTRMDHRVRSTYTFNLLSMARAMLGARLYINGGGSLIQDSTSNRSLYFYLMTLVAARLLGCRVMMYGCGIGPVQRVRNRRLAGRILDRCVHTITLREDESAAELAAMGVHRPRIVTAADPAMVLSPASDGQVLEAFREAGIPPEGQYLCLCMRNWPGFERIAPHVARAADYACRTHGLTPVLLPIEMPRDADAGALVASHMECTPYRFERRYPSSVTIGVMARMRAVLSMRLHALVFAASQGVPIAGIIYDQKVGGFMRYMGQTMFTDMDSLTEEVLRGFVDRLAATQPGALREDAQRLRTMEARNIEEARRLLSASR